MWTLAADSMQGSQKNLSPQHFHEAPGEIAAGHNSPLQASRSPAEDARGRFPAGLEQAPGSYRFGLDALLLAAFACQITETHLRKKSANPVRVAELGCGCGAALLAFSLRFPNALCLGIDRQEGQIACARENTKRLDVNNMRFCHLDVSQTGPNTLPENWLRRCDCVMANPPWRKPESGKTAKSRLRREALWAGASTLADFCRASRELLSHHAWFCCVLPPASLPEFCAACAKCQLGLKQILPVANMPGESAIRLLLACRKEGASAPELLAPLALREKTETGAIWSGQARQFCPWLK